MSDRTTARFAPGEVSPEQLEQFRLAYEAAKAATRHANTLYNEAYRAWCDELAELRKAESVYVWAQRGMVQEQVK